MQCIHGKTTDLQHPFLGVCTGAQFPASPPFPKTSGMRLEDIQEEFYTLLPVPKKKPKPLLDEKDVENLLDDLFEAVRYAQEALGDVQGTFTCQDATDSFERSLLDVERRVRGALEKSDITFTPANKKYVNDPY